MNANTSLHQIKNEHYRFYVYLVSKYNQHQGDEITLGELCRSNEIEIDQLLEKYAKTSAFDWDDEIEFQNLSTESIVEFLIRVHHRYLKDKLPGIADENAHLSELKSSRKPNFGKITTLLSSLVTDILKHIEEEEKKVFPALVQNTTKDKLELETLELEHEEVEGSLRELNRLSHGFECPIEESLAIHQFYKALEEVSNLLYSHIHIERDFLFK